MLQEAESADRNNEMYSYQEAKECFPRLLNTARWKHKHTTAARQVALKAMGDRPVIVSAKLSGLIEVVTEENVTNYDAVMTDNATMDVYPGRLSHVTISSLGVVNIHVLKHPKVDKVADALKEIVHIKNKHFACSFGVKATKRDSLVNTSHLKPTPDRFGQSFENVMARQKSEVTLKQTGEKLPSYHRGSTTTNRFLGKCPKSWRVCKKI